MRISEIYVRFLSMANIYYIYFQKSTFFKENYIIVTCGILIPFLLFRQGN